MLLKTASRSENLPGDQRASSIDIPRFRVNYDHTVFLKTSRTRAYPNRLNWRCENLLTRNHDILQGKNVLDLGSHDGRFSYACLRLGGSHVTGIEGRSELVTHADNNLLSLDCRRETFKFVAGDAFNLLSKYAVGSFNTILCLGFFYHTIRQIELLSEINRLKPQNLILDTRVVRESFLAKLGFLLAGNKKHNNLTKARLHFRRESHDQPRSTGSTIDSIGLVAIPTKPLIEILFHQYGFRLTEIKWENAGITDWSKLKDYTTKSSFNDLGTRNPTSPHFYNAYRNGLKQIKALFDFTGSSSYSRPRCTFTRAEYAL
jgi:2-polyprenyl-3-methyl-5-hydroxy-6-metoxy-1,4-benzoquinol methylase